MASAMSPSYLLAPNWTYRLNGPISLGNIIVDPLRPHRSISRSPSNPVTPLETITATELNWNMATDQVRGFNIGLWTELFNLGIQNQTKSGRKFSMASMDTVYYATEPTRQEVELRIQQEPRLQSILRSRHFLPHSAVYLITGLKIARGFTLTYNSGKESRAEIGFKGNVAPVVTLGTQAKWAGQNDSFTNFESENDIVFAYQLLRIKPKGRGKNRTIHIDEFHHRAAFLSDNVESDEEDSVEVDIDGISIGDLVESQRSVAHFDFDGSQREWLFLS